MSDILKHTMAGFDAMCCPTCMDLGELCDSHGWAREDEEDEEDDIDDGYRENESQADYEARSFGVPRQGPI